MRIEPTEVEEEGDPIESKDRPEWRQLTLVHKGKKELGSISTSKDGRTA